VIDGGKKESESESEDPHRTDVKPDDKAHAWILPRQNDLTAVGVGQLTADVSF
jgi:hypothetical protein